MRHALLFVVALAVGCGGGGKPAESPDAPTTAPPRLPPSMGGPGGPKTDTDAPASPADAPKSDEVAKGAKALEGGDAAGAKGLAMSALKKNPKDPEALALLGMSLEALGDKPGAEKSYKDALKIRPDLEAASVNLSALLLDQKKWDDAEKACRGGLSKHKENPLLHLNLAMALSGKKDQAGATSELDEAARLAPTQPIVFITYADRLAEWNQPDAAVAKLKTARGLAEGDVAMLATIGHSFLVLRAVAECIPTFDKAIAIKDAAELRTERGLCKLGAKDKAGALADFQAAVAKEPNYALAHYWTGALYAQAGKPKEALDELATYLKLDPNGAKAPLAKDLQAKIKAGGPGKK